MAEKTGKDDSGSSERVGVTTHWQNKGGALNYRERLAAMGNLARVGWWELDFEKGVVYWSSQVKEIHEVPLDFSPSFQSALNFVFEEDRENLVSIIEDARLHRKDYRVTVRIITAKGKQIWARSTGEPVLQDGECIGMRGVCQDVTVEVEAEKSAKENDRKLKKALAFAHVGFYEWNWVSNEVYWDRGCCLINGIDAPEMCLPISKVRSNVHEDDREEFEKVIQRLKDPGDKYDTIHRIVGADGIARWVHSLAEVFESEKGEKGLRGMAIDITSSQLAKEELRLAKEEADRANRAKTEFLAIMNHELRTPLSTIIGPSELALQIAEDPRVRRFLEMSMESGRHLLDLINRVLDLARIESGQFEHHAERTVIRSFLKDLLKPLSMSARREGIELDLIFDCPEEIMFDRIIFRQVLFNLVGNAIKYCGGSRIRIKISTLPQNILLTVEDDGKGIEYKERERIFKQFHQISSGGRPRVEGSGLGLSICRRLAELIGGSLEVVSAEGQGATFVFRMPYGEIVGAGEPLLKKSGYDAVANPSLDDGGTAVEDARVLIVEDDETNRSFLESLVASIGLASDSAESGEEAIELFRPGVHRVILMDIWLSGMTGEEAAKHIREKAGLKKVYIIAQTAGVLKKDGERLTVNGMDDFIMKPISISVMVESIRKGLVEQSRSTTR